MIKLVFNFKFFLPCFIAMTSIASAMQENCSAFTKPITSCFCQPLWEVKTGYFCFSDSKMDKIYDKGGLDIQLCASYPVWNPLHRWTLNAYAAIEYFYRSGKSTGAGQKTSLWCVPINAGLKPVYAINNNLEYYCAFGPRYFYIHQHNSSSYVSKNQSRNGLGFFINTGFNYALWDHLIADAFGEYSYAKVHFHSTKTGVYTKKIQIGGFTVGGGLGYKF